jgi:hypothetical protein
MPASSRLSLARSRTSQAASLTVPLVLLSDGTICNSEPSYFHGEVGSLQYCRYNLAIGVPVEVTAAVILLTYWDSSEQHIPLYTAILIVCDFLDMRS